MIYNPLEQFTIFSLYPSFEIFSNNYSFILSFTNSNFFLILNFIIFILFITFLNVENEGKLKPNTFQFFLESIFNFIYSMLIENVGINSKKYFSWVFFVFLSLSLINLSGMIPYSFTVTSHLIITIWFALCIFIGLTLIGIKEHGFNFLSLFLPPGVSLGLAPLLVVIEILSYFIRVISLSVRLFANMMSGHILLKVLLGFAWTMMITNSVLYIIHFIPIFIVFLLLGLELGVSLIQAYIFTILLCIYLNDVVNLH